MPKYKLTFISFLRLARDILHTKIFYNEARLIRHPFYLRYFEARPVFANLTTGVNCRIDVFDNGNLTLGTFIQINDFCHIACAKSLYIGNNVLIGSRVFITDHDHSFADISMPISKQGLISDATEVGDNSWIGEGVSILKGAIIGKNCVVGANAVVLSGRYPDFSVLAGVPARIIKTIK